MSAHTAQLRVTLPLELQDYLHIKASRFGLNMSAYVKNLIINDVRDEVYPTFQASKKVENSYQRAMKEKATAVEVTDIEEFFDSL